MLRTSPEDVEDAEAVALLVEDVFVQQPDHTHVHTHTARTRHRKWEPWAEIISFPISFMDTQQKNMFAHQSSSASETGRTLPGKFVCKPGNPG